MGILKKTIIVITILIFSSPLYAEDIYLAATAAGGDTGANCANAKAYTFFNSSGNWGAGDGKITAGDTVHICGTITQTGTPPTDPLFTFQASGTEGNVITLLFETDAILQSSAFGYHGAIYVSSKDYIKIDGGTNGIIQNTDNGSVASGKTYHVGTGGTVHLPDETDSSDGIHLEGADHVEICNLTIRNIYINTGGDTAGTTETTGMTTSNIHISNNGGAYHGVSIHNNTLTNSRAGVWVDFEGYTVDDVAIYSNTFTDHAWMIIAGAGAANSVLTNFEVYNNEMSNWTLWQCPSVGFCDNGLSAYNASTTYAIGDKVSYGGAPWKALTENTGVTPTQGANWEGGDHYHTDGLIMWSNGNSANSSYSGKFYNNYVHGSLGAGSPSGYVGTGCGGNQFEIFNNLFVCTDAADASGCMAIYNCGGCVSPGAQPVNTKVYNNTFIGMEAYKTTYTSKAIVVNRSGIYMTVKNNIFVNYRWPLYDVQTSAEAFSGSGSANNNLYYNHMYAVGYAGDSALTLTLTQFQAEPYSQESGGLTGNPLFENIASDWHLQSESPAIGAGTATGQLSATDKDGVSWDTPPSIGAYEYAGDPSPTTYTVTLASVPSGITFSPNANQTIDSGATASYTISCTYGYTCVVSGCGGTWTSSPYVTAAITGNCTVTGSSTTHFATIGGSGTVTIGGSGTITLGQ